MTMASYPVAATDVRPPDAHSLSLPGAARRALGCAGAGGRCDVRWVGRVWGRGLKRFCRCADFCAVPDAVVGDVFRFPKSLSRLEPSRASWVLGTGRDFAAP